MLAKYAKQNYNKTQWEEHNFDIELESERSYLISVDIVINTLSIALYTISNLLTKISITGN